jgi:hypothetical protein
MNFFRFLLPKRKNWRWAFFVALLLALTVVSTAYATMTFDPGQTTGPTYVTAGYQFTMYVNLMDDKYTHICINYTGFASGDEACTCTGAACPVGTWTCVIAIPPPAGPHPGNATFIWSMNAYKGGASECKSSNRVAGPNGQFTTGSTAVVLQSFTSDRGDAPSSSIWSILLIAAVVVLLLLALGWTYRIRKNKLAMS